MHIKYILNYIYLQPFMYLCIHASNEFQFYLDMVRTFELFQSTLINLETKIFVV